MNIEMQDKMRVYKDAQTRLWTCQRGLVAGVGTTPRGAYQNMTTRQSCPLTILRLQRLQ